jgi:nucleotide-binding universal stress UspA family protein
MGAAWRGFRSILCPVDFSDHSRLALRYAAALAARGRAALTVLHVDDPLLVAAAAVVLRARGDAERAALLAEWFGSPLVPVHVARGRSGNAAAHDLAAIAKARRASLIVTTLRDRRGWFGARRGSISYHVLTHAVVPVLACPASWQPR